MGSLNCNVNVVLHVHDNIDNHSILVLYAVKHYGLFYQCVLSDYVASYQGKYTCFEGFCFQYQLV